MSDRTSNPPEEVTSTETLPDAYKLHLDAVLAARLANPPKTSLYEEYRTRRGPLGEKLEEEK